MFDVSWTDPTRETVGQRKTRKNRKVQNGADSLSRATSVASTGSRNSQDSATQTKPSFLDFLGPKKSSSTHAESQPRPSALRGENPNKTNRRISTYTASSESSTPGISSYTAPSEPSTPQYSDTTTVRRIPTSVFGNGSSYNSEAEQSNPSELSESIFSGRTGRSIKTDSTWSSVDCTASHRNIIQPLDSTSFVSQSTEVTVSPRESLKTAERVATVVHISAAGTVPVQINDSQKTRSSQQPTIFDFPMPQTSQLEHIPSPTLGREIDLQSIVRPIEIRDKKSDTWKPPDTWECPPDEPLHNVASQALPEAPRRSTKKRRQDAERRKRVTADLTHLKRSIRRMEAASSKIVLERLKEEWIEAADASVYRELELEKQLWMLTALRKKIGQCSKVKPEGTITESKVLSLFENEASASVLSVLAKATEVHHLSISPLSPRSYPNVHPLQIPGPTHHLPYASNIFKSISSFSLPSLLPASSIPLMLRECHRCLTSSSPSTSLPSSSSSPALPTSTSTPETKPGKIHLTLLDPSPIPSTVGPLLRTWLDTNLMINLETQFRCLNPSRLFPLWLSNSGLRGEGSTILHVQFLACYTPCESEFLVSSSDSEDMGFTNKGEARDSRDSVGVIRGDGRVRKPRDVEGGDLDNRDSENTKVELKSVVGRMLWREIWGPWVLGRRWWWEDGAIVKECERLGTKWEYAVIEGVKEC